MFSNLTTGLLLGLGVGAWVYNKLMRSTGSNTKNALIGAAIAGGFGFIITITLLNVLF